MKYFTNLINLLFERDVDSKSTVKFIRTSKTGRGARSQLITRTIEYFPYLWGNIALWLTHRGILKRKTRGSIVIRITCVLFMVLLPHLNKWKISAFSKARIVLNVYKFQFLFQHSLWTIFWRLSFRPKSDNNLRWTQN